MEYKLLENVHKAVEEPTLNGTTYVINQPFVYYHYKCDNMNDVGWGCGYRTLQSICSTLQHKLNKGHVPTIPEIQEILVKIGDKEKSFEGSRDWIGTLEASYVIDEIFEIPCYLHHIQSYEGLKSKLDILIKHFTTQSCLIMMGGDMDASSKGIAGVHISDQNQLYLLVIDPHFSGKPMTALELAQKGYVKWTPEDEFLSQSFYNFCMPKIT